MFTKGMQVTHKGYRCRVVRTFAGGMQAVIQDVDSYKWTVHFDDVEIGW